MLVLSRKKGEEIRIGQHTLVKVLSVSAGRVRLGIQCPREVPVHREEVYQQVQQEILLEVDPQAMERTFSTSVSD